MLKTCKIVGILNITTDSFSDGGLFTDTQSILNQCKKLIDDGANIIDIGAESTRPGACAINAKEEWQRLSPVISDIIKLCSSKNILSSLDTRHPENAVKAVKLGIDWINDVSGCINDQMIMITAKYNKKIVLMHNLGVPAQKEVVIPENKDAVTEIYKWAEEKIIQLINNGIKKENIIFDPGLGFGKTSLQSLEIIKNISIFKKLGVDILVGHSRKSFLSIFTDKPAQERDLETASISLLLSASGVDYIRVHNVKINRRALSLEILSA